MSPVHTFLRLISLHSFGFIKYDTTDYFYHMKNYRPK